LARAFYCVNSGCVMVPWHGVWDNVNRSRCKRPHSLLDYWCSVCCAFQRVVALGGANSTEARASIDRQDLVGAPPRCEDAAKRATLLRDTPTLGPSGHCRAGPLTTADPVTSLRLGSDHRPRAVFQNTWSGTQGSRGLRSAKKYIQTLRRGLM